MEEGEKTAPFLGLLRGPQLMTGEGGREEGREDDVNMELDIILLLYLLAYSDKWV